MVYTAENCKLTHKLTVKELQESFNYWVARHPTPDENVIAFGSEAKYSPRQLNDQIQTKVGHGQLVLEWLTSSMNEKKETPTQAIEGLMCKKQGLQRSL